jgi:lipopolysaccharide exporter
MHTDTLKKSLRAGNWAFINVLAQKVLMYGSFFILARLLTPLDFGIIALIAIVPTLLDGVTSFAFDTAAVQGGNIGRYLNVVWTFNILRSTLIFICIFVGASWIATFYRIEAYEYIVRFGGLAVLIQSFGNIGQTYFFVDMDFKKVFLRDMVTSISYAIVALGIAWFTHSFLALFIAGIMSMLLVTLASYALHPYRPRFDFNFRLLGELRSFSQWVYAQSAVEQISVAVQNSIIGRSTSPASLALFMKAKVLSDAPTTPVTNFIGKVSFSSYVRIQNSPTHLSEGVAKTIDLIATIALPYLILILFAGHTLVLVVLGESWTGMTPLLQILVISASLKALINSLAPSMFNAIGKPKIQFLNSSVQALTLTAGILLLVPPFGAMGAAYAVLASVSISAGVVFFQLHKHIHLNMLRVFSSVLVTVLATGAPLLIARYGLTFPFFNTIPGFLMLLLISGCVYIGGIVLIGRLFSKGPYKTLELIALSFFSKDSIASQ